MSKEHKKENEGAKNEGGLDFTKLTGKGHSPDEVMYDPDLFTTDAVNGDQDPSETPDYSKPLEGGYKMGEATMEYSGELAANESGESTTEQQEGMENPLESAETNMIYDVLESRVEQMLAAQEEQQAQVAGTANKEVLDAQMQEAQSEKYQQGGMSEYINTHMPKKAKTMLQLFILGSIFAGGMATTTKSAEATPSSTYYVTPDEQQEQREIHKEYIKRYREQRHEQVHYQAERNAKNQAWEDARNNTFRVPTYGSKEARDIYLKERKKAIKYYQEKAEAERKRQVRQNAYDRAARAKARMEKARHEPIQKEFANINFGIGTLRIGQ